MHLNSAIKIFFRKSYVLIKSTWPSSKCISIEVKFQNNVFFQVNWQCALQMSGPFTDAVYFLMFLTLSIAHLWTGTPLPNNNGNILWGFPFSVGQIDQISIWGWPLCFSDVRTNIWRISFLVTEWHKWRSLMWLWSTFLVTRHRLWHQMYSKAEYRVNRVL